MTKSKDEGTATPRESIASARTITLCIRPNETCSVLNNVNTNITKYSPGALVCVVTLLVSLDTSGFLDLPKFAFASERANYAGAMIALAAIKKPRFT